MMIQAHGHVDAVPAHWGVGETLAPPVRVLAQLTDAVLSVTPHAEALVVRRDDGSSMRWTYEQLDADVGRRVEALRGAGIRPGDAVVLVAARVPGLVPTLLALLRLGAAYVPVDPAAPDARWRTVADAAGARAIIGPTTAVARAASALAAGALLLDIDALSEGPGPADVPAEMPDVPVTESTTAYVLFTSGSTGEPKGVVVSHDNVAHRIESYLALTDGPCRYLLHSSLCFDGAVGGMFSTLARGGCLVLVPDAVAGDPALVATAVREERVTHLEPVPSWYAALLDLAQPGDLDSVRVVILGGEVLPPALVAASHAAVPGARLFNDYGPTEVTVAATVFEVDGGWRGEDVPIGRPHANTTVAVLDESLEPVALGQVGELWVGGPCVAQGYLGMPEHPSFQPDPATGGRRYRTGDLVRWGADGLLHFSGRRDRQVKIRGQRIEPEEVESVLLGLPGVAVAAVEVDTAGSEPRLVAYVAAQPRATLASDHLDRQLADLLPAHLRPAVLIVMPALPLTPGGKVDRRALPAPRRNDGVDSTGPAPRTPEERMVAEAFAAVLDQSVSRESDFFTAGGQSLGAARVVARLRAAFGVEVSLADLVELRTPAALAPVLRDRPPATPEPPLHRHPRPRGEVWRLPASPRQQSFWYLEYVPGGSGRSNLVELLGFPPGTDPALLRRAVEALVERHSALRTAFELTPEGLLQVVQPQAAPRIVELPAAVDAAALDELADSFGAEPFELTTAPLVRAGLTAGPEGPVLILVVHHAVADGWSLGLLLDDVAAIVRAGGDASGLPEPAVEYADFVEWTAGRAPQRHAAAMEHLTPLLLRGAAAGGAMLPFDRPPAARPGSPAGLVTTQLSPAMLERITELSRSLGTTVFTVLAASLGALLARSAGLSEVVLSGPLSGRGEPALDRVVGCCINTGLFPVDIAGQPAFTDVVQRVTAASAAGEQHGWLPLEMALRPLDDGVRATVAPVLLNLLETQTGDPTVGDGRMQRRSRPSAMAYSELDVYLEQRDGGLAIDAVHSLARLDHSTVEQLLRRWLHLLDAALEDPHRSVADLPLLTPDEVAWLDGVEATPGEPSTSTVLTEFRARTIEQPHAVAVIDDSGSWTRQELWDRAGAIAVLLAERGVDPGDAVVLAVDETADAVAALIACWRAGAVPIPVGESQPAARVEAVAASSGAVLVLDGAVLDAAAAEADWPDVPLTDPVVPAYVLYTSGSTGEPKGVVIAHSALAASTTARLQAYPERPQVALITHDLAFDAGLGILSWYLWTGGTIVMAGQDERLDPQLLAALVARHGVGQLDIVPSHYRLLLDLAEPSQLASLALVTLGGEACQPSLVRAHRSIVPAAALVNEYGPTEFTVWAVAHTCTVADETISRVPIGRPISGVAARVCDAAGHRLPPGAEGELLLAGPQLADGYLGDPGRTAERFVTHDGRRWYRTGDRVRWTEEGSLDFLGRLDTQLKVRGFRIEPGEIETTLTRLEEVSRAAVEAVELIADSPVLVGWVELTSEAAAEGRCTPTGLRDRLLELLPEWLVPQTIVVVDGMPETTAGKIDRDRLPRPEADPSLGGSAAETATEKHVATIWADLLGRPVPVDRSFFSLGGQSLLAARMVARVRSELAVDLDLRDVLDAPRVRDIAALVDAGRSENADPDAPPSPQSLEDGRLLDNLLTADRLDDALARVEELTDDQVEALLARMGEL
jgi:amino acid adenylation domain-containing protein